MKLSKLEMDERFCIPTLDIEGIVVHQGVGSTCVNYTKNLERLPDGSVQNTPKKNQHISHDTEIIRMEQ